MDRISGIISSFIDTNGLVSIASGTLNPSAFDVNGGVVSYSLAAGGGTTGVSNSTTHHTGNVLDNLLADMAAFGAPGGGNFNVLFNTLTGTNVSNTGGNTGADQVTTATGSFSIFYTYDDSTANSNPVPEPASLALLGVGVLGSGLIRRFRRK